eukprot:TRINITY_DN22153_c0_g1_i1.p1 TRINITY_DN22153_c0_g1~~TRINITY_DN22153_c0_g1_i1.p1  ORF type:complete len:463 (-),score=70.59 TRINITY_DN22153_c0_g1_i1:1191-2579(-)
MRGDSRSPDKNSKDVGANEHQKWLMESGFMGDDPREGKGKGKGSFKGGGKGKGKSKGGPPPERRRFDRDREPPHHSSQRTRDGPDRHERDFHAGTQRRLSPDRDFRRGGEAPRRTRRRDDSRGRSRFDSWEKSERNDFAGRDRLNGQMHHNGGPPPYKHREDSRDRGVLREPPASRRREQHTNGSDFKIDRRPEIRRAPGRGGFESERDRQKATIRIQGCPADITEEEVSGEFGRFGLIYYLSVRRSDSDTFAFVTYERVNDALQAIREMDDVLLFGGCRLTVDSAIQDTEALCQRDSRPRAPVDQRPLSQGPPRRDYDDAPGYVAASEGRKGGQRSRSRSLRNRPPPVESRPLSIPRSSPPSSDAGGEASRKIKKAKGVRVNLWQLPPDMEPEEFLDFARDFGTVLGHDLWKEGKQRCGWLEYATTAEARRCVQEMHDRHIEDWPVKLKAMMSDQFDGKKA